MTTKVSKYVVWEKEDFLEVLKPGISKVSATFKLTRKIIDEIKLKTQNCQKYLPMFEIDITDEKNEVIARNVFENRKSTAKTLNLDIFSPDSH